jgi:imidazolonepropionase-like amidohydrolase
MKIHSILVLAFLLACCGSTKHEELPPSVAYVNATIFDGSALFANGVMIVRDGIIQAVGTKENTPIPENATEVDLSGKFIIPGLINSHGHVAVDNANVTGNLELYARYGITTVVSLGGEKPEIENLRDVIDTSNTTHARLYIAGDVITGKTPQEAVAVVDKNKDMGVDWMKIRVDDNLGSSEKMTEDVYKAVIARSHDLGYKIATHMYYLDDAKKLLKAGSDMMAHSVRDKPIDDEFIDLIKEKNKEKKVCYCPTLTRELSTFVYETTPDFFADPFFTKEYDTVTTAPLEDPSRQQQVRNSKSAQTYKQQLPVAMANLRKLSGLGVPIAFGTDSGIPTRFIGYYEHLEMQMMADAGLSPAQILISATKDAAECMGLKNLGQLKPGFKADFISLNANPLVNIKNTREISGIWIGGKEVKR